MIDVDMQDLTLLTYDFYDVLYNLLIEGLIINDGIYNIECIRSFLIK